MVYKCKICGGSLSVASKTRIATCEYCGTQQVLPQFSDDSGRILYERGNHYLSVSEYDKAESIFNQLLAINPNDPEFYWDLVLCKYGVTFVCDPQSGKYIPTCNRTHFSSILHDENFQKALQISTPDKAALYQQNADTIDEIQKGILALSRKEKPFDIFISYKETDANGNRSRDSVKAQDLYEKLTSEGYKVFFSRITLEDKIGTQYEPYIYAALSSSKVMLTVCSSKEYIESAWVKNEWSRFLTLRQSDASKTLIPLYYDMQKSDLPEEFAILSAQDMQKEDFEQELIRGIKKLIPLPIMLAAKRKKQRKTIGIAAAVFCGALLLAGAISFLLLKPYAQNSAAPQGTTALQESSDYFPPVSTEKETESQETEQYNAAMQLYYDGNYPEAAWAFRDMDGFNDSAEMQKKCELAWRESLATIAVWNDRFYTSGSYYISANGTVETLSDYPGTAASGIDINAHGKIVSLAGGQNLYALYEDGYVWNCASNNQIDADWTDIIQISPHFVAANVALKTDGTVVCGISQDQEDAASSPDNWLLAATAWEDVVAIDWGINHETVTHCALLVGINSAGDVLYTYNSYHPQEYSYEESMRAFADVELFLSALKEIKAIRVYMDYSDNLCVAALDVNGKLFVYINGNTFEAEQAGIEAFEIKTFVTEGGLSLECKVLIVDSKRSLHLLDDDKTIMEDVVYCKDGFLVTHSGSIYEFFGSAAHSTEAKTEVKDIWLERR